MEIDRFKPRDLSDAFTEPAVGVPVGRKWFWTLLLRILSLFRISGLGFRIACCVLAWLTLWLPTARAAEAAAYAGITEPVFDVTLSLPVPGIITRLNLKEGDFVQTNEVILELDNRLEELEVARRKCILDNHKADWESTRLVFDKTASVSRDEMLKKESDYKVSLAEYQEAQEQLQRRQLVAPGAGVICDIKLHRGEACAAYEPVVRVVDTRRCYFISNIDARDPVRPQRGQTVTLDIEASPVPVRVEGRIVFVSPVVDSASGLQRIKVVFDNLDGRVRPGVAGKVMFPQVQP
jgi:RND family efflux transporter MFP subunit